MSVLDRIFSESSATNDAALATLSTQLTQAQQLIAAQQATLDALGITSDAQQTALAAATALNTAQQAAIAAAQAAEEAQASSLAAATGVNSAQQAAIDTHATQIATLLNSVIDLDVRNFTGGAPLTAANFQDATEAAISAAYAVANAATPSAVAQNRLYAVNARIRIPAGVWPVSRTLQFPATGGGTQKLMPVLCGAGMHVTQLVPAENLASDGYTCLVHAGTYTGTPSMDGFAHCFELYDMTICAPMGTRGLNGVVITAQCRVTLRNLNVTGFGTGQSQHYKLGWGIVLDDQDADFVYGATPNGLNNQYVTFDNVWSQYNRGGLYIRFAWASSLVNAHLQCNSWHDVVVDDANYFSWHGGTVQGGTAGPTTSDDATHLEVHGHARVVTGWNTIIKTGSGASIGVRSGDVTVVTGLSGLDQYDLGRWLELTIPSNAYNENDKVSGMYCITRVVNATTAEILKGSSHAATSGLAYKVRTCWASRISMSGQIYHEQDSYSLVRLGGGMPQDANYRPACLSLREIVAKDFAEAMVVSYCPGARISIEGDGDVNTVRMLRALQADYVYTPNAQLSQLDLDSRSYASAVWREPGYLYSRTPSTGVAGGLVSTASVGGARIRTAARVMGANFILDARVASSFSLSGSDVNSWTDLQSGITSTLMSGVKPVRNPSDSNFGGAASVRFTDTVGSAPNGLQWVIPANKWPSQNHAPALFVVSRIPDVAAASGSRSVQLTQKARSEWLTMSYCDIPGSVNMRSMHFVESLYGLGTLGGIGPTYTPDALPHARACGGCGAAYWYDSTANGGDYNIAGVPSWFGWDANQDRLLFIQTQMEATPLYLDIVFIAAFPFGLTFTQRDHLFDMAANELKVAR